jgi:5-methylthioadenosine/S-adenosylhomocysteine deaminase
MDHAPSWDLLILGGTVLTLDGTATPITDGAVAVQGRHIAAVGTADELLDSAPTCEVLNAAHCLVTPGLVNTHSHLAMVLLRGLADDLPLMEWLQEHIWPAERRQMDRDTVALGSRLAAAEQLLAGVTTTADMYFFADTVCESLVEAGQRGVVAESLIDAATPRCATPQEMMAKQRQLCEQWKNHPLITPSVAPHAPYSVCDANLVAEAELAREFDVPLQIHLSETRWEIDTIRQRTGLSPVAHLARLGVFDAHTVAAHCVHVDDHDIALLRDHRVHVAHNPVSNLKLASGIAPVPALLEAGITVGIGTDGAASNNTLDLLRDLQIAALIHKNAAGDPTALPAHAAVEMATSSGARTLGLDDRIGRLRVGAEADIVCWDTTGPHMTPLYDPASHLAFACRGSDARHVMVAGRTVVRDRQLLTMDLERLRAQVLERARAFAGA